MNPPSLFAVRAERGFTLIELMIAVTIGLLLTVVVASLFIHSRSTYGATDELSRMQENIRYTNHLLARMVHHAGYMSTPNAYRDVEQAPANTAPLVVYDAVVNPVFTGVEGVGLAPDGFPRPDSFTVRFQGSGNAVGTPDGTVTDCQGREIDSGQFSANRFFIQAGANGGNALWCNNGVGDAELVPDVENMQLLLGEDIFHWQDGSARRDRSTDRYLPITDVLLAGNMNKVMSVRVALLFRTPNIAATVVPEAKRTYNLNGVVVGPYNDKRIRRAVAMSLNVRNRSY